MHAVDEWSKIPRTVEGLSKMSQGSGAWVVTGGEHSGVMKLVGQALCGRVAADGKTPVPCIGICTWGRVNKLEGLKGTASRVEYNSTEKTPDKNRTPLDPHHTCFLLVDDGTKRRERTHQKWHSKLNEAIMNYSKTKRTIDVI